MTASERAGGKHRSLMGEVGTPRITALVLAGGQARRMGGIDKGLVELRGRPLVEWVLAAIRPQVDQVLISANRSQDRYGKLGLRVLSDARPGYLGPLAGMLSGLEAASGDWLLTLPCDSPLVPPDLAARLAAPLTRAPLDICVAHDGQRMQPVFSLLRRELADSLRGYLDTGERKIDRWFAMHRLQCVDFSDIPRAFLNVNTRSELRALEQQLAASGSAPASGTDSQEPPHHD